MRADMSDRAAALVFIQALDLDDNLIASIQKGDFEGIIVLVVIVVRSYFAHLPRLLGLPHLKILSLRRNRLSELQSLEGLGGLSLTHLYLTGNEATQRADYPTFAASVLPYIVHE